MSEKRAKDAGLPKVDARKILQAEAAEAENACEREIRMSLAKYKCNIEPTFIATAQGNMFNLRIAYKGFDQEQ